MKNMGLVMMLDFFMAPLIAGGIEIMSLILFCGMFLSWVLFEIYTSISHEQQVFVWFKNKGQSTLSKQLKKSLFFPVLSDLLQHSSPLEINAFHQKFENVMPHFERRLRVAEAVVQTAPLLGLLGTVSGMIITFTALQVETNNQLLLASGIAHALYTTEFGLLVAIPGVLGAFLLQSKIADLRNDFKHLLQSDVFAQKIKKEVR